MEHQGDSDVNLIDALGTVSQRLGKENGRVKSRRMNRDHPGFSIVEIGQNTEQSPGDLKKLAVTQTPMKGHQLTLVWNNLQGG